MRGKVIHVGYLLIADRITPAYAGKSGCVFVSSGDLLGSPPPMRGKVNIRPDTPIQIRITPAYAGKSSGLAGKKLLMQDHPRLCGEKAKKIPKQRYFFHQPASFSFSLQYT